MKIDAARQASDWREEQIVRLRTQMNKASRAVQEYKARRDYRLPPKMDEAVTSSAGSPILHSDNGKDASGNRRDAVTLEELEVSALAYRKIYENNLQAHADAVLRQTLQFTNARVITLASVPKNPTFPRTRILAIVGAFIGAALGFGICVLRYAFDRIIRTTNDLERIEHLPIVGSVPAVKFTQPLLERLLLNRPRLTEQTIPMAVLHYTPLIARNEVGRSLHDVLAYINRRGRDETSVTIGLTGIGSSGARSMVTGGIAAAAVNAGKRVLLVDLDIGKRTLSTLLAPGAAGGIFEVSNQQANINDVIAVGVGRAVDILPVCANNLPVGEQFQHATTAVTKALEALGNRYDLIIVDLPNASDARSDLTVFAPLMHQVVCVVECGVATIENATLSIRTIRATGVQPFGAILYASDDVNN